MLTPSETINRYVRRLGLGLGLLLALPASGQAAEPPPWHYVGRLGLADARHTAPDGFQSSEILGLSDGNYTVGASQLFVGADDVPSGFGRRAQTGWIGSPVGATVRVGLYDATHTRDDGRQETYPYAVSRNGMAIGASVRFIGHEFGGETAWVATSSGQTVAVGFYDPAHTASDGSTVSEPTDHNQANKLVGFSLNPENGHRSGWVANSIGQFNRIGLLDAAHTSASGRQATFPVAINDNGFIIGNSDFYAADEVFPGSTAWVRRPDRVMRSLGFQSGVHQAANGQHVSRVEYLMDSGYLAGWSTRYAPGTSVSHGQTAWVTHVDGPNRPVGLYTGLHLGANGVVHSEVRALNEAGNAIGTSYQYAGANPDEFDQAGSTAWITTPAGATVTIGLYDAEHTGNGHHFNEVVALNPTGSLVGYAVRYLASGEYHGTDAFVANAAGQTSKIGLADAAHTRDDGYHASFPTALTDGVGYVAGYTERYHGGSEPAGQTAWVYHRTTRTYVRLELSVRASDGHAESTITRLLPDGSAVGRYRAFASDGTDLGERAFAYLAGDGVYELDDALDIESSAAGWDTFVEATDANANGYIVGPGVHASADTYGAGVYLLNEEATATANLRSLLKLKVKLKLL